MNNKLQGLTTNYLGRQYEFLNIIDSTQTEIWRRIENKTIENGALIMANIQTNGKGTHGRIWHTDENNNIAFSIYVKTNNKINLFDGLTFEIAKTIVGIFKNQYNINIEIKSPNDLMINNKKIGGILTESRIKSDFMKCLVIGIGINTNKLNFSKDIENIATSIKKEYKIDVNRFEFVTEFCNVFENVLNERIK